MAIEILGGTPHAYTASLVLVVLITGINIIVNLVTYYFLKRNVQE